MCKHRKTISTRVFKQTLLNKLNHALKAIRRFKIIVFSCISQLKLVRNCKFSIDFQQTISLTRSLFTEMVLQLSLDSIYKEPTVYVT